MSIRSLCFQWRGKGLSRGEIKDGKFRREHVPVGKQTATFVLQTAAIEMKSGDLRLKTLALTLPGPRPAPAVKVTLNQKPLDATATIDGSRIEITLAFEAKIGVNDKLTVVIA